MIVRRSSSGRGITSRERPFAALTLAGALAIGGSACGRPTGDPPPAGAPAPASSTQAPAAATDALDRMDERAPVPLLPMMAHHQKQNMRDHLVAVQEIVGALAAGDYPKIERAAGRIGYSEQMGRMCSHMGAGAPGFTDQAIHFHKTADRITEAARKKDGQAVLTALGETLTTCTSCHAAFKQKVLDEEAWAQAAGEPRAAP